MPARSRLEVEDARRIVLAGASARAPLGVEKVALDRRSRVGRVLAQDVTARDPVPPFDSSAMDGFAVRAEDVRGASPDRPAELAVVDESRAGAPAARGPAAGEAVAISTGAVVPASADAIVRVEDTQSSNGHVRVLRPADVGQDVRRAGDDIAAGRTVLAAGTRIGAVELGVLASLACETVSVARRPRVAILATGDELLAPGEPTRPGAIRETNSLTLAAFAERAGAEVVEAGRVGDDPAATREALRNALAADVAVVCGGVSVGVHDHVRPALAQLGAEERFWGLALRPGGPTWFGTTADALVFGLPGNPVSAIVTFILLVEPALRVLEGEGAPDRAPLHATLDSDFAKEAGRMNAIRVRLRLTDDGWHAEPMPAQGSHVLTSLLGADGLALIPTASELVRAGERVEVLSLWRR
jgi:molybdopterin molybdotransferase